MVLLISSTVAFEVRSVTTGASWRGVGGVRREWLGASGDGTMSKEERREKRRREGKVPRDE